MFLNIHSEWSKEIKNFKEAAAAGEREYREMIGEEEVRRIEEEHRAISKAVGNRVGIVLERAEEEKEEEVSEEYSLEYS
jgi:hypothetical protein